MRQLRELIDRLEIELTAKTLDYKNIMECRYQIRGEIEKLIRPLENSLHHNPWKFIRDFCEKHDVEYDELLSKSRKREIREVRQALQYYLKKNTFFSLDKIGTLTGGRSHATILHSIKVVEEQPKVYEVYLK